MEWGDFGLSFFVYLVIHEAWHVVEYIFSILVLIIELLNLP